MSSQKSKEVPLYHLFNTHFGKSVRMARAGMKVSQEWVAAKVGVSRQTIMSIERGESCPSFYLASCLLSVLPIDPSIMQDLLANPERYAEEKKI